MVSLDYIQSNSFTSQCLHKNLHTTTTSKSKDKMESRFLLDIVICKSSTIFQLLTSKDQTLLVRRNTLLILDLLLDIFNCVTRFNIQSDSFTSQSFDENLHSTTTSKSKDKMESRFLLDIIICKSSTIFQLLTSENQTLLIRRNTFLVLDFLLYILNGITGFNIQSNSFTSQCLHKNLHTTTTSKSKDKMESRFLLDPM